MYILLILRAWIHAQHTTGKDEACIWRAHFHGCLLPLTLKERVVFPFCMHRIQRTKKKKDMKYRTVSTKPHIGSFKVRDKSVWSVTDVYICEYTEWVKWVRTFSFIYSFRLLQRGRENESAIGWSAHNHAVESFSFSSKFYISSTTSANEWWNEQIFSFAATLTFVLGLEFYHCVAYPWTFISVYPLQCNHIRKSTAYSLMVAWPTKVAFAYVVNELPATKHYRSSWACQKTATKEKPDGIYWQRLGPHIYILQRIDRPEWEGGRKRVNQGERKTLAMTLHMTNSFACIHILRAHNAHMTHTHMPRTHTMWERTCEASRMTARASFTFCSPIPRWA